MWLSATSDEQRNAFQAARSAEWRLMDVTCCGTLTLPPAILVLCCNSHGWWLVLRASHSCLRSSDAVDERREAATATVFTRSGIKIHHAVKKIGVASCSGGAKHRSVHRSRTMF